MILPMPALQLGAVAIAAVLLMASLWIGVLDSAETRFRKAAIDSAVEIVEQAIAETVAS